MQHVVGWPSYQHISSLRGCWSEPVPSCLHWALECNPYEQNLEISPWANKNKGIPSARSHLFLGGIQGLHKYIKMQQGQSAQ